MRPTVKGNRYEKTIKIQKEILLPLIAKKSRGEREMSDAFDLVLLNIMHERNLTIVICLLFCNRLSICDVNPNFYIPESHERLMFYVLLFSE